MKRKSALILILLVGITGIVVFFAVKSQNAPKTQPAPTGSQQAVKTATVYFNPGVVSASLSTSDIYVDTHGKAISGVQVELSFDPKVISEVSITPSQDSFFGKPSDYLVLFKNVDMKNGRASFAIGVSPTAGAKNGVGKVATVSFIPLKNATVKTSIISFVQKTMVTSPDQTTSVLKDTTPLIVSFE